MLGSGELDVVAAHTRRQPQAAGLCGCAAVVGREVRFGELNRSRTGGRRLATMA